MDVQSISISADHGDELSRLYLAALDNISDLLVPATNRESAHGVVEQAAFGTFPRASTIVGYAVCDAPDGKPGVVLIQQSDIDAGDYDPHNHYPDASTAYGPIVDSLWEAKMNARVDRFR